MVSNVARDAKKADFTIVRRQSLTQEQEMLASFAANDDGNAQAVEYRTSGNIRYTDELGWFVWNGSFWQADRQAVKGAVADVLTQRRAIAELASDHELRASTEADRRNIAGAMYMLETYAHVDPAFFDSDNDALPAPNGIIDLKTGKLLPHDPATGFTFTTTVDYNEQADYSQWVDFLTTSVKGGTEELEALQMFAGYMLTGHTREEKLMYITGPARSGKGTFTETLQSLLPSPISQGRSFSTFTMDRRSNPANFDLASLSRARMVFASESSRQVELNAATVKSITGGDSLYAEYKGKEGFNFKPHFKIMLTSNFDINADVDDGAVWGRLIAVEFPHSHLDSEDTSMKARFQEPAMLQGVLKWAVEGAVKWYARGRLVEPESYKQSKREQRDRLDMVARWLEERTVQDDSAFLPSQAIIQDYETWSKENGVTPKKARSFALAMENKGYRPILKRHQGKNTRGYVGLDFQET